MKRHFLLSILAGVLALALLVLPGCSHHQAKEAAATPASSSSMASSTASSQQEASSEENQDSSQTSALSGPSESQPGPVLKITTDSAAFNQKFADNPLDKAYVKESNQAVSTVDMVNVSQKYAGLWQKEIDHAWKELLEKMKTDSSGQPAKLQAEQKKWEAGKSAALKKINSDALAAGGSMAEVNEASQVMDFYRNRAAQLYRELYQYESNYSYAYKAK
jgi:hypothetical protein